jgi:hypothetical protein
MRRVGERPSGSTAARPLMASRPAWRPVLQRPDDARPKSWYVGEDGQRDLEFGEAHGAAWRRKDGLL